MSGHRSTIPQHSGRIERRAARGGAREGAGGASRHSSGGWTREQQIRLWVAVNAPSSRPRRRPPPHPYLPRPSDTPGDTAQLRAPSPGRSKRRRRLSQPPLGSKIEFGSSSSHPPPRTLPHPGRAPCPADPARPSYRFTAAPAPPRHAQPTKRAQSRLVRRLVRRLLVRRPCAGPPAERGA